MEYTERNTNMEYRGRDKGGRTAALVIGLIILLLVVGAIAYFAGWRDMNDDEDQNQGLTPTPVPTIIEDGQPTPTPVTSPPGNEPNLGTMPQSVRDYIADTYPDFHIDDVEQETVDGQTGWRVELDHNADDQDDVDLYYSADWELVRTEVDD